ncbi:PEGA domain-containing protein [Thiospirochaeta perfilievii]|uniref:PEGA domain-containing protein n=1 Tax=Thiospirochaeta perfilievii TaxID=252967 RepID=A0A5C1QFA3_9SPIO|nr:PEGA domain-containing protein [Thiospirochaeta perfilievii]QEN06097.1 PEGA domain-containing protein [Thiospirochaeta perfilievii]
MIDTSHINIKLKDIFKISPNTYIPIFYGLLLIFILLLITVIPGLLNNRTNVIIKSSPTGAAVFIDNELIGSTPLEISLPKGSREFTVKKEHFFDYTSTEVVERRKSQVIYIDLESKKGLDILKNGYANGSRWSLVNSNQLSNRYRIPNIISEPVLDYYEANDFNRESLESYLESSLKLITNEFILSDYLRALAINSSNKKLLSVSSIKNSASFIEKLLNSTPNLSLLIYNKILLRRSLDIKSPALERIARDHQLKINKNVVSFKEQSSSIKVENLNFINIPESQIPTIDVNFIHNISNESFYILEEMVDRDNYFKFLEDNPKWSKENTEELINKGLVDKFYLDFSNDEDYITNISYYAAKAWCEWANEYYNIPSNYKISLPSENLWLSANQFDILDNVDAWQWTNQGFYIYDHFLTKKSGVILDEFDQIEAKLVVGKNKYNTKAESSRGVQNASWCTPFLSFRPVLIRKSNGKE